jgi:hypothetical protein
MSSTFDFLAHLHHQAAWSAQTFGPGDRTVGVVDHIRKELDEVLANPTDVSEWIDVVILALDGAWRVGATPEQIIAALVAKQTKNEGRQWPDWRTAEPGKAIEHIRAELPAHLTTDPTDPRLTHGNDDTPQPQADVYLVLSKEKRAEVFIRPLRHSYKHQTCGGVTTMGLALAETYACDPKFYGATYCSTCQMHKPVSEFTWTADGSVVGS